jgi:signal transduction histidine kinase
VSGQITYRTILRVLLIGFASVIGLLLTAGLIGFNSAHLIARNWADLVRNQRVATRLLEQLQREQETLSLTPGAVDRERILSQLEKADQITALMVQESAGTPQAPLWQQLHTAATSFSIEAHKENQSRDLLRLHQQVTSAVARIVSSGFENALAAQSEIEQRSKESVNESIVLFGGSLLLAILCAVLTLRIAARLVRRMELQSTELSRVTWHMLENQETTARRFSHELHDELGQTLTAIKANLAAIRSGNDRDAARVEDCNSLVDDAIRNVRELSQLLHPTILDDFGLDASLRWLAERFTERTGIEIEYESNFNERLSDDTETHVFRIVQEALTNVARHSQATKVRIQLGRRDQRIHLCLIDNGKGLQDQGNATAGMGLTGMRARARGAGGELQIASRNGAGVSIELWAPINNAKNGT